MLGLTEVCCRKMSPFMLKSHQLLILTLILPEGLRCDDDRTCQFEDSKFFLQGDVEDQDFSDGKCSFTDTLCKYSQACTDKDAEKWEAKKGKAVCPGKNGALASFSVLLSPLLKFNQDYCLKFNYSQSSPGKPSVFLATSSQLIDIKPEEEGEGSFSRLVNIRRSVGKIGFKARSPNGNQEITLSFMKLQSGNCGSVLDCSTVSGDSIRHCAWNISFPPERQGDNEDNPEAAEDTGGKDAAVVAGVVVPVVVVVAVVIVGVFIWRHRRHQLNHNHEKDVTRPDTRNTSSLALGTASSNSSSENVVENSSNVNTTATAPQSARSGCSYATVQKHNTSNNPDPDYYRMGSAEARRRGHSEAGYYLVEDDYSHIASTYSVAGVGPQAAASRRTDQNSTAGEGDSSRDQNTSRASEDDYSVVSAGNKQIKALSDQRSEGAEKAYSHLTSNVEGDYDRIRREDREDVPGCDYDHVGRHTQDDYDQVGQRDKTQIIGNDYDHLV